MLEVKRLQELIEQYVSICESECQKHMMNDSSSNLIIIENNIEAACAKINQELIESCGIEIHSNFTVSGDSLTITPIVYTCLISSDTEKVEK